MPFDLTVRSAQIDSLHSWPGNPRTHDLDTLGMSLRTHGQYRPLVVQSGTRRILAGNGTWEAAKAEGWDTVDVTFLDVDDDQAARIVLADNRLSDLAGYDDQALLALLESLPELEGTGYAEDDLRALTALLARTDAPPLDPYAEWQGLPEFEQNSKESLFHVVVHFASDADAEKFFTLIDRPKKSTMWWPEHDGLVGSNVNMTYVASDVAAEDEPADVEA